MDQDKKVIVEFGELVRQLRMKHFYSLEELAEKVNLSPSYIWRIEQGKREARLETKLNILVNGFGYEYTLLESFIKESISVKKAKIISDL